MTVPKRIRPPCADRPVSAGVAAPTSHRATNYPALHVSISHRGLKHPIAVLLYMIDMVCYTEGHTLMVAATCSASVHFQNEYWADALVCPALAWSMCAMSFERFVCALLQTAIVSWSLPEKGSSCLQGEAGCTAREEASLEPPKEASQQPPAQMRTLFWGSVSVT